MSLDVCVAGLVADGTITPERGRRMLAKYEELLRYYKGQMGEAAAAAEATGKTLEVLTHEAALRKRQELLQVSAQRKVEADMRAYGGGNGSGPIDGHAAVAKLAPDRKGVGGNAEGLRRAVRARAHAMIASILGDHHTNIAGQVRMKAQLVDIVRELFGEDAGNANARELAEAWRESSEMLRQRFNRAGGDIGKMENWGLPQSHDTRAIRDAGFEAWRDEIAPRLDRLKMLDSETGLPFSDEGFGAALKNVYETISTDGWNNRKPGGIGGSKLGNRRADARFLQFKSAGDWLAYQQRFGVGSPFDAMMGHIDGMSRDIALMETLGPNPTATIKWMKDTITQSAALDTAPKSRAPERANAASKQIDRYYAELTGAAGRPENRTIALYFSAYRSINTAAKLGGAMLSALPTDPAFGVVARRFNGLPVAPIISDYVKYMASHGSQEQAARLTGIADEWSHRAGGQQRVLGEELTSEVAQRLAEGALRITGLNRFTEAGRWALGMSFLNHITSERARVFDKLDPRFQRCLQRYGIDAAGWDHIRATPLEADGSGKWIKPANIEDHSLGDKIYEMIQTEIDYGVPTPDIRTRAFFHSIAPSGTWRGEFMRSAFQFKSFGVGVILQQSHRIMEAASVSGWNLAKYAAGLFIATTIGGALAVQLKSLAGGMGLRAMNEGPQPTAEQVDAAQNGKPIKATDGQKFWAAAVLQGGGFGIFGDFIGSTQNRMGGGLAGTIAGPMVQDVQDTANIITAKNKGWAAARKLRGELPGGSTWYARLAFDRLVTDQIQEQIDPNYRQSWRRMEDRAKANRTSYWWKPGDTLPASAPDFESAGNAQ